MSKEIPTNSILIPPQPLPECATEFVETVSGLLDGRPKDEATVARALEGMDSMFDVIAAALYSLASMLVGEGEDSIRLVETAVATTEVSACDDALHARKSSRRALCAAAIEILAQRDAGSLAAPANVEPAVGCIDDDDLSGAGISTDEFNSMLSGPNRDRVREWLTGLATEVRVVFALRAVAGFTAGETAALLAGHGGASASGWTPDAVRVIFRQGLCSLASQLIHSA